MYNQKHFNGLESYFWKSYVETHRFKIRKPSGEFRYFYTKTI